LPVRISPMASGMQSWPAMAKSCSRPAWRAASRTPRAAQIGGSGDQDALSLALAAEKIGDRQLAGLAHAVAVELDEAVGGDIGEAAANAVEGAGDAALDKAASLRESDAEDPVGFALPLAEGVLGEQGTGFKSRPRSCPRRSRWRWGGARRWRRGECRPS